MKRTGLKQRKILRLLLWPLAILVIAVVLMPVWFPWVLKPVLQRYGLRFRQYERAGYTRFVVNDLIGEWKNTRLEANRVECVLPTEWVWQTWIAPTNDNPAIVMEGGKLIITQTGEKRQGSTDKILNRTVHITQTLESVLPSAVLTNCAVLVDTYNVSIQQATWRTGQLHALLNFPELNGEIEITGHSASRTSLVLQTRWKPYELSIQSEFSETAEGWQWNGEAHWLTNRAEFQAQFATNGCWPTEAHFDCPQLSVPAELIRLTGYDALTATLKGELASNYFSVTATGKAHPSGGFISRRFSTTQFSLAVDGGPEALVLRTFDIQSPWLQARLTNHVGVSWTGELLANAAQFHLTADLEKFPGETLTGRVSGSVDIKPRGRRSPVATFNLSAADVHARRLDARQIRVAGEYSSPMLRLYNLNAELDDGSALQADVSFNTDTREILKGDWKLSGDFLKRFLATVSYDEFSGSGEIHGPVTNLSHSGKLTARGFSGHGIQATTAEAKWQGQNLNLTSADIHLKSGNSTFLLEAIADLGTTNEHTMSVIISNALLSGPTEPLYSLQQPCTVTFRGSETNNSPRNWTLAVDNFDWRGTDRFLKINGRVEWPALGKLDMAATNVSLGDFSDFLDSNLTNLSLQRLAATAVWSNGPVHAKLSVGGSLTNQDGRAFGLRGDLTAEELLSVSLLTFESDYTPTLSVTGTIPFQITPSQSGQWLAWNSTEKISLTGRWKNRHLKQFTVPLGARRKLDVAEPDLLLRIFGTPEAPQASLDAAAAGVTWVSPDARLPRPPDCTTCAGGLLPGSRGSEGCRGRYSRASRTPGIP